MKTILLALACSFVTIVPMLQAADSARPIVYIEPADGFEVYMAAALTQKKVPVDVATSADRAQYVFRIDAVEEKKISTGSKAVNCLFANCAGNADRANTSVQVVTPDGMIAWSYSVQKGRGTKNKQVMAESIAKHFYNDFLKKRH